MGGSFAARQPSLVWSLGPGGASCIVTRVGSRPRAMIEISDAPGLVLAGGLARRMGGGDKPLREIGGQTILARVIARLAPQCACLLLSANGDPSRFASFGLPVIADGVKHYPGPLAGI